MLGEQGTKENMALSLPTAELSLGRDAITFFLKCKRSFSSIFSSKIPLLKEIASSLQVCGRGKQNFVFVCSLVYRLSFFCHHATPAMYHEYQLCDT